MIARGAARSSRRARRPSSCSPTRRRHSRMGAAARRSPRCRTRHGLHRRGGEADALVATKPVYGGSVLGEFVMRGAAASGDGAAGAFQPRAGAAAAERFRIDVPAPASDAHDVDRRARRPRLRHRPSLKDAKIVVAGGRGLGGPENWHYIEEARAAARCGRRLLATGGRFRLGADVHPSGPERHLRRA